MIAEGGDSPDTPSALQAETAVSGFLLRNGSSVFVRVISVRQDGSYVVSGNGIRFIVSAEKTMLPGMTFNTTVQTECGRIRLVPSDSDTARSSLKLSYSDSAGMGERFSSLFAFFNLPADRLSFRIISHIQKSGVIPAVPVLGKVRQAALYFPEREASAADAALMLAQKGLVPDADMTGSLLEYMQGSRCGVRHDNGTCRTCAGSAGFPSALYAEGAFDSALPGLLTLVNHICSGREHWAVLPFCFSAKNGILSGSMKYLFDLWERKCRAVFLNVRSAANTYYFALYFEHAENTALYFWRDPPFSKIEACTEEKLLGTVVDKFYSSVCIRCSESAALPPFFKGDGSISLVDTEA